MSEFHGKSWGYEQWIVNNDMYCGKILHLWKDHQCSYHYHKIKHETFYVLSGEVLMQVNNTKWLMKPGDSVTIEIGDKHQFTGLQTSEILEISTQHFEDDSHRLIEGGKVTWKTYQI
jgi:quercetin dioxygenase-like cupin family protein